MPNNQNIYEQLLAKGYTKQSIHKVLHTLILEDIKQQKLYEKKSFAGKMLWHIKRFVGRNILQPLNHITATGLFLLKTQFIKKPKSPV